MTMPASTPRTESPSRLPEGGGSGGDATPEFKTPTSPKRINVAVNPETLEALQRVVERENVSLTEAVRRLLGYGDVLYRAVKEDGAEVLLKTGTETKQIIIL